MLEQMRKHMNWIMWIILVMVIVSFLFFGIYQPDRGRGEAAKVNGDVISANELDRAYRNMYETYRQIFKEKFTDAMARTLRQQALRELIENRLLVQEASRIGLRVSDEEVQASIMRTPAFAPAGRFDKAAYERYLDYINTKPSVFEETQREYMLKKKIERIIEDGIVVTDDELKGAFAARIAEKKKGSDLDKDRESFRTAFIAEKKRDAVNAYVQSLYKKGRITMNEAALTP